MLITDQFEVDHPVERVWVFDDIPGVARSADRTQQEIAPDHYGGGGHRPWPRETRVRRERKILERNVDDHTIKIDAAGAENNGRGHAQMMVDARLEGNTTGNKVSVAMDLNLSGAAAQYGRGLVSDVTAVLLRDFAGNAEARLDAIAEGRNPDDVQATSSAPSSRDWPCTYGTDPGVAPVLCPVQRCDGRG